MQQICPAVLTILVMFACGCAQVSPAEPARLGERSRENDLAGSMRQAEAIIHELAASLPEAEALPLDEAAFDESRYVHLFSTQPPVVPHGDRYLLLHEPDEDRYWLVKSGGVADHLTRWFGPADADHHLLREFFRLVPVGCH